jgi:hypothetical protein
VRSRTLAAIAGLSLVLLLAPRAQASSVNSSYVFALAVTNDQFAYLSVAVSAVAGSNPCSGGTLGTYGIDLGTTAGRAQLSLLEGAQLAGKKIGIGGAPASVSCTGGQETLGIVTIFTN